MPELKLYSEYSRHAVHDFFSPDTRFSQSTGTWGLHGIIEIPNHSGDFVFFVTFGQHQADHVFEEWITEDGVIAWQSQPSQSFQNRKIQQFIHHDEHENSIYLFLRTKRSGDYTYFGKLRYLSHNPKLENPVYLYWQAIDWPVSKEVLSRIDLKLLPNKVYSDVISDIKESGQNYDLEEGTFKWNGKTWKVDRQALISQIREQITSGLPKEATRFRDWYIDVDGQRISPKWVFHLITDAGYDEFDSPSAREKLSGIGLAAEELTSTSKPKRDRFFQLRSVLLHLRKLKPTERSDLFQGISRRLLIDYPEILSDAYFRFPNRENWFEIHVPALMGYYYLRLGRQSNEIAYYFPGNAKSIEIFKQQIKHDLIIFSDAVDYSVMIETNTKQSCGRLTFKMPSGLLHEPDNLGLDSVEIAYSRLIGRFIQSTFHKLVSILPKIIKSKTNNSVDLENLSLMKSQILNKKLESINQVLNGSIAIPADEPLCDLVHFCYDFGLYQEGQMLFNLVSSENVNPWYYERTKKIARLCVLRGNAK